MLLSCVQKVASSEVEKESPLVVPEEDVHETLLNAHRHTGHGRSYIIWGLQSHKIHITRVIVVLFLILCPVCQENKGGGAIPLKNSPQSNLP